MVRGDRALPDHREDRRAEGPADLLAVLVSTLACGDLGPVEPEVRRRHDRDRDRAQPDAAHQQPDPEQPAVASSGRRSRTGPCVAATTTKPKTAIEPRPDPVGQPPDDAAAEQRADALRDEHDARADRVAPRDLLVAQRQQEHGPVQREAREEQHRRGGRRPAAWRAAGCPPAARAAAARTGVKVERGRATPIASGIITSEVAEARRVPAFDRPRMTRRDARREQREPAGRPACGLTRGRRLSRGRYLAARIRPATQNCTFTPNMNRQLRWVRIAPPTSGPRIGPSSVGSAIQSTVRPSALAPARPA